MSAYCISVVLPSLEHKYEFPSIEDNILWRLQWKKTSQPLSHNVEHIDDETLVVRLLGNLGFMPATFGDETQYERMFRFLKQDD